MTDILHTLPNFPTKDYTHLIPSLEKNQITTTDLLTLDALEVAKRAQLPLLDVRRLATHILEALQGELGLTSTSKQHQNASETQQKNNQVSLRRSGVDLLEQWHTISTLSTVLDASLSGGIPTGYITEIAGERSIHLPLFLDSAKLYSGAGKTQLLLTLLLAAQLPAPQGLSRQSLYISTEAALSTSRLSQILRSHPILKSLSPSASEPSLNRIFTLQTPDLESQDHILTYQLPVALTRHNIGLIVIDSIAANYRAEHSLSGASMAQRSAELVKLGAHLRKLAREYDCAVVVANQVGDRFAPLTSLRHTQQATSFSSSPSKPPSHIPSSSLQHPPTSLPSHNSLLQNATTLTLDHQLRFFTGWGDSPNANPANLKTPSLGLVWSNQISCRIALIKELCTDTRSAEGDGRVSGLKEVLGEGENAEWTPKRWRRWMRVVFAPWCKGVGEAEKGVEIEIWEGGVRGVGEAVGGV